MTEWKKEYLGDHCEIILGGTPKTNIPEYWGGDIPWASVVDFNVDKYLSITEKTITDRGLNESNTKLLQPKDMIISARGTVGKTVVCAKPIAFNQSCYALRSNSEYLNQMFLYYLINYHVIQLQKKAIGGVFDTIIKETLRSLEIMLPSDIVQQKIASILTAYDNLIENNIRRIEILEEMAQRIYKEWFVDFKYPGHGNDELVDSKLGMKPRDWEVGELGDQIIFTRGRNLTQNQMIPGTIPVVSAGINPSGYHTISNVEGPGATVSASGANAGYISLYLEDIWASDCSYINKDSTKYFFYYFSLIKEKQVAITAMQRGAAQPHVYPNDVMQLSVLDVPKNIIEKFETNITPVFEQIGYLRKENINLRQTREYLLPKLISGKVDVAELDIDTGILDD